LFEDKKYNNANTSEYFVTAGRTLRTGVVSNAVVAQWTWAATLLQR
jgi:Na+/proline symporter